MQAVCVKQAHQTTLIHQPLPALPSGGAILAVSACGLCGSDLDKLVNHKATPGMVLGHEVVGVIEQLAPDHMTAFNLGDRVVAAHHVPCRDCHYCASGSESMCRQFKASNFEPGGFAEYIAVSADHLQQTVFKIPTTVSNAQASCVEPLACVIQAIQRAERIAAAPQSVAILGLGFIGQLASQVYRQKGYWTLGLDINPVRCDLARQQHFADAAYYANNTEAIGQVLQTQTPLGQVDVVFLSIVNEATITQALSLVRDGGTLVLFASSMKHTIGISPDTLYFREISVIPSYSPSLASLREAVGLIFTGAIQTQALVSHHLPLSRFEEGVALYQSGQAIKVLITVNQEPP